MSSKLSQAQVSVVMAVYDQPDQVRTTIESVLAQQGVDLELIVVSDGASSKVLSVVHSFADARLNLLTQSNQGLTVALINGCERASSEFIARIDSGDQMLEGRLAKQADMLRLNAGMTLVSCGVEFVTEEGDFLYNVVHDQENLRAALRTSDRAQFESPVHASVMFRKSAYQKVGGYRAEFYFAQDCDLWSRMIRYGEIGVTSDILQRCTFSAGGLSGRYRDMQQRLTELIVKANDLRDQGRPDNTVLRAASEIRPSAKSRIPHGNFEGLYFIASILSQTDPKAALKYWQKALLLKPFSLKARIKCVVCWLKAVFKAG